MLSNLHGSNYYPFTVSEIRNHGLEMFFLDRSAGGFLKMQRGMKKINTDNGIEEYTYSDANLKK